MKLDLATCGLKELLANSDSNNSTTKKSIFITLIHCPCFILVPCPCLLNQTLFCRMVNFRFFRKQKNFWFAWKEDLTSQINFAAAIYTP